MVIPYYCPTHKKHTPPFEVFNGDHDTAQEVPERAFNIQYALEAEGFAISETYVNVPPSTLKKIHASEYISFLLHVTSAISPNGYLYPSVHPYISTYVRPKRQHNPVALRGQYIFDTYTPLLTYTYEAAYGSASLAYTAALHLKKNAKNVPYALCRPPGHHAERAMAGGYCYLNNAAVAAEYLSRYGKVAVLDVDFHHGNGTQHIFYTRSDVFTASIHADPAWKYPFYSGFADEVGMGNGRGFNMNIPLGPGITDNQYQHALEQALIRIGEYRPAFLIVSYGADTHESDPIGGFSLTTPYFTRMAQTIHLLGVPTMVVQEGGYNNEHLGRNVVAFLKGFT